MEKLITVQKEDHIATVTLTKPTMPPAFFSEMTTCFSQLNQDSSLRAIILKSSAKAFSYGLDLHAAFQEYGQLFTAGSAKQKTELLALIQKFQSAFQQVANCPIPVIAATHRWCIGGGLDLISACDIRLTTEDTRFSLRETKIAIVADLGSLQRLPQIIGMGNLKELAFSGKDITAIKAKEMGLVNEIFPDREQLTKGSLSWAMEIAQNPPLTVRGVKEVLRFGEGKSIEQGLQYVAAWNTAFLASEDLAEAVAAFAEGRPPRYKGK